MNTTKPMTPAYMAEVCEAAIQAMQANGLIARTIRLQEVRDQLAALSPPAVEGFVQVPREPTKEMRYAGRDAHHEAEKATEVGGNENFNRFGLRADRAAHVYAAMLAAAPVLTPAGNGGAVDELRRLYRAYVRLLETGRDRIRDLGGDCDGVDVMEQSDIDLRRVREYLAALAPAAAKGGRPQCDMELQNPGCTVDCDCVEYCKAGLSPPADPPAAGVDWLTRALDNKDLVGPAAHFASGEEVIQTRILRLFQRQAAQEAARG